MNSTTLIIIVLVLLGLALVALLRRKSPAAASASTPQWEVDEPPIPTPNPEIKPPEKRPVHSAVSSPIPMPPPPPPPPPPEPQEPDVDQNVLDQLREAGSNLSRPHQMEFLLLFSSEENAQKAASRIKSDGFSVEVRRAPQGSSWICLAMKRMVPKRAEIAAIGKKFTTIAQEFNGDYDGWETSIEK